MSHQYWNATTTKANATKISIYTLTYTSNTFQITQQHQAWGKDKYENAHIQAVAIEFSRKKEGEPSTLRTFYRLKKCVYKEARQCGQWVSYNSISLLWSCVFEDRRCEGLTNKCIAYKNVVSRTVNSRMRKITNKCGLQKSCKQIRIRKE